MLTALFKGIVLSKMKNVTIYSPSCFSKQIRPYFHLQNIKYIFKNVSAVFVHTVKVNGVQNAQANSKLHLHYPKNVEFVVVVVIIVLFLLMNT